MKLIPKKLTLLASLAMLTGCFSCTSDESLSSIEDNDPQNELYRRLQQCYDLFSEKITRGEEINILDTDTKYYTIIGDSVAEVEAVTRSTENEFSITRVSFEVGNTQGFTILTEDPRIEKVYFFTDKGCISDTAKIGSLKWIINNIPSIAAYDLVLTETCTKSTVETPLPTQIGPLNLLEWGQEYPFNIHTPYCKCNNCSEEYYKNHRPIGCVTTAVAQLIVTVGKFKGTYFGSRDLDFSNLPLSAQFATSMQDSVQVISFMKLLFLVRRTFSVKQVQHLFIVPMNI